MSAAVMKPGCGLCVNLISDLAQCRNRPELQESSPPSAATALPQAVIYLHLNSRPRVGGAAHLVKVPALQVLGSVLDLLYGAGPGHAISWSWCWEMETSQPSFHFTVLRACGESEDVGESTQQKPGSRGKKQEAAGVTISL